MGSQGNPLWLISFVVWVFCGLNGGMSIYTPPTTKCGLCSTNLCPTPTVERPFRHEVGVGWNLLNTALLDVRSPKIEVRAAIGGPQGGAGPESPIVSPPCVPSRGPSKKASFRRGGSSRPLLRTHPSRFPPPLLWSRPPAHTSQNCQLSLAHVSASTFG